MNNVPRRQLVILDSSERFWDYRGDWQRLERHCSEPVFFQSFAWCGHVAATQAHWFPDTYQPFVCVGLRDGDVTAIWPLCRKRSLGMWTLQNLDDPFGQFAGILATDPDEAAALVGLTIKTVRRDRLAHLASFERVAVSSPLFAALRSLGGRVTATVGAPYLDLTCFASFEAFRASRNKKTLKNLRNAHNRLCREGMFTTPVVRPSNGLEELMSRALVNRTAWLKDLGLTSPPFRMPSHHDVLFKGERWGLDELRLGFDLRLDQQSIAQQWGFVHNNRYYAYMSGSDTGSPSRSVSLGGVHLSSVIAACFEERVSAIDFLTPASAYKMVWTDTVHDLADVTVETSLLGRSRSLLFDRGIRPLIKAGFHRLPAYVRRQLVGGTLR